MDHILTKMEQRLARITVFDPCRETWLTTAERHKHGFTVDAITEIQGPLGFALTLHPRIKAEVQSTTMNAWYLVPSWVHQMPFHQHCGLWREMGRPLASTSNPLYLRTSLLDEMVCASLAAPSAFHQLAKRCCRAAVSPDWILTGSHRKPYTWKASPHTLYKAE